VMTASRAFDLIPSSRADSTCAASDDAFDMTELLNFEKFRVTR
jgi:hypothetical protein